MKGFQGFFALITVFALSFPAISDAQANKLTKATGIVSVTGVSFGSYAAARNECNSNACETVCTPPPKNCTYTGGSIIGNIPKSSYSRDKKQGRYKVSLTNQKVDCECSYKCTTPPAPPKKQPPRIEDVLYVLDTALFWGAITEEEYYEFLKKALPDSSSQFSGSGR